MRGPFPGLAHFANKHGIAGVDLAAACRRSQGHITLIMQGERAPSKAVIDALLRYCRRYEKRVTYDRLFGVAPLPAKPKPAARRRRKAAAA